jgi:TrmH family RNA methyltransferase
VSFANPFENLRVVLVSTRNPLNIGAAARAMSNFAFPHLRVVNPYEPAFREARSAVGAADVLARAEVFDNVATAVADCSLVVGTTAATRRELQHPLRRLKEGASIIRKRLRDGKVALLFGSERTGLLNEALSHCDWLLRIPTHDAHRSINLGQAVAICLYELARDLGTALELPAPARRGAATDQPASAAELERIGSLLLDALRASGSLQSRSATLTEEKLRRMLRRHKLTAADAEFWLGMLRSILWKLGHSSRDGFNASV